MKDLIGGIVWVVSLGALGLFLGAALDYLEGNSMIVGFLMDDLRRITTPLVPIIEPVAKFIAIVFCIFWGVVIVGGCLVELYDRLRRRKAASADKHKREPVKRKGKHQPEAERQGKLAMAWADKYDREKVYRKDKSQHRLEAERKDKPPALDKAPPAAKFNRAMVYRNGQWMTRSEAERQDKHKREPVKRIYKSQHRSEAAEAARQAFTPDEWHRLGDLRATVIDGSMGRDEARRLLAGDGQQDKPPAPITPPRPSAKREPVIIKCDDAKTAHAMAAWILEKRAGYTKLHPSVAPYAHAGWDQNAGHRVLLSPLAFGMVKREYTQDRDKWRIHYL